MKAPAIALRIGERSEKSENQESDSDEKAARMRTTAVQKHSKATTPASQGKKPGKRQNRTNARIVSVPSIKPAAWKNDLRPLVPVSGSPRPAATTARPRNEAQVHTKEASRRAA